MRHDKATFAGLAARQANANFMSHTGREPSKIKYGLNYAIGKKKAVMKKGKENISNFLSATLNDFPLRRSEELAQRHYVAGRKAMLQESGEGKKKMHHPVHCPAPHGLPPSLFCISPPPFCLTVSPRPAISTPPPSPPTLLNQKTSNSCIMAETATPEGLGLTTPFSSSSLFCPFPRLRPPLVTSSLPRVLCTSFFILQQLLFELMWGHRTKNENDRVVVNWVSAAWPTSC